MRHVPSGSFGFVNVPMSNATMPKASLADIRRDPYPPTYSQLGGRVALLAARLPRSDLRSGVDSELVHDMLDVLLHGPR